MEIYTLTKVAAPDVHRSFFATEQGNTLEFPVERRLQITNLLFVRSFLTGFEHDWCLCTHVKPEDDVLVRTLGILVNWTIVVIPLLPFQFRGLLHSVRIPFLNDHCGLSGHMDNREVGIHLLSSLVLQVTTSNRLVPSGTFNE